MNFKGKNRVIIVINYLSFLRRICNHCTCVSLYSFYTVSHIPKHKREIEREKRGTSNDRIYKFTVLAIELLASCQAIEFLRPLKTTPPLEEVHKLVRKLAGYCYLWTLSFKTYRCIDVFIVYCSPLLRQHRFVYILFSILFKLFCSEDLYVCCFFSCTRTQSHKS